MGYGIFGQKITGIRDIKTPLMGPQGLRNDFVKWHNYAKNYICEMW